MKLQLVLCYLCIGYAFSAPASEPSKIDTPNVDVEKSKDPIIQPLEAKHAIAPISAAIFPEQEQDASSAEIRVPVDNANRLLYDLDATVNNMFDNSNMPTAKVEKSEDESIVDGVQVYSAANRELDFFPRQNDGSHQGQASVVTQLENLEKRLLNTINELQTRRRYFSSTMLRQMYNSVHRIRVNISRMQNQFSAPHSSQSSQTSPSRPSAASSNLQQRVSDIQKAVNDIINRVTSSFQPAPKPSQPPHQVVNQL